MIYYFNFISAFEVIIMKVASIIFISVPIVGSSLHWIYNSVKENAAFRKIYTGQQILHLEQVQVIFRHGARTPLISYGKLVHFANIGKVIWDKETFMQVLPWANVDYTIRLIDGGYAPTSYCRKPSELLGGCLHWTINNSWATERL